MPYSNGYSGQRVITIPAGRVPGPLTDFPFFWHTTDTDVRLAANGGLVQSSSGYDIIFTSDSAGTTILDFEVVVWNSATGFISAWIKLPTVSDTSDNVLYAWFGNSSITSPQSPAIPWDSNYKLVDHFASTPPDGTHANGTVDINDSTANGNNFTSNSSGSGAIWGINGQLQGDGILFTAPGRSDSSWLSAPNAASIQDLPMGPMTVEYWADSSPVIQKASSAGTAGWGIFPFFSGGNKLFFELIYTTTPADFSCPDPTNGFTHVVITYDGIGTCKIYANGVSQTVTKTGPSGTQPSDAAQSLQVSGPLTSWYGNFVGRMDELRISNVVRSANYAAACFNNQSNPQYFSQTSKSPNPPSTAALPFTGVPAQVDPLYQPTYTRGCGFPTSFTNNTQVPSNSRNAQFAIGGKLYQVAIGFPSTFPGSTVPAGPVPNAYGTLLVEESSDNGVSWAPLDVNGMNPFLVSRPFVYSTYVLGTSIYVAYLGQNSSGSVQDIYVGKFDTVAGHWVSFTAGAGVTVLDLDIGNPYGIGLYVVADGDYIVIYGYSATTSNIAASHYSGGSWAAPSAPVGATVTPALMGFDADSNGTLYVFYSETRSNQHDWGGNNGVFYFPLDKHCNWGSQQIAVFNMKNGEPMNQIGTYPTNVDSMCFLPNGKRLASLLASKSAAEFDGDVKVYPAIFDIDTAGFLVLSTSLEDSPDSAAQATYWTQMVLVNGTCYIFWAASNLNGPDYVGQPISRIRYSTTTDGITFNGPFTAYDLQLNPPPNYLDMGFELDNFSGNDSFFFGITQLNVTTDDIGSIYVSFSYGAWFTGGLTEFFGRGFFYVPGTPKPRTKFLPQYIKRHQAHGH